MEFLLINSIFTLLPLDMQDEDSLQVEISALAENLHIMI